LIASTVLSMVWPICGDCKSSLRPLHRQSHPALEKGARLAVEREYDDEVAAVPFHAVRVIGHGFAPFMAPLRSDVTDDELWPSAAQ
jgi:hypothetical protein